ncbi:MAG: LysE family translocator [Cyclobacteriaceae bacterium]|jgi:threonine/homoserine/homoserine lactone efflux protein|nr:LysE family translocator [Cyclobacteriaceae bacterium]MDH4295907.1 LysE family translocator [Cyclobacteriaceae bacterium]MDH5247426.1 LysE family translocator [Cyclobacteriaceae bacterium]
MIVLLNFSVAFFFSFVGTIPPGTLNLTILQLGIENKIKIAWRFGLAAAIIEYPYAWLAVKFEQLITSSPLIAENAQLITAIVMTLLGIINLWSIRKTSKFAEKFNNSGFRRGLLLGILNPLALPFWVGTTAYLNSQQWINLTTTFGLQGYLFGVSIGTLTLFILLAYLAKKVASGFQQSIILKRIPGIIMLALGLYAFIQYFL